jgi:hypothetical protein
LKRFAKKKWNIDLKDIWKVTEEDTL